MSTPAVVSTVAPSTGPSVRRLHFAATARIVFGLVWAVDASFKWLPGFVHGQTLSKELGKADEISVPVVHQWIELWHTVAGWHPGAFAAGIAVLESLIAIGLISGAFSNLVLVGSAIFSFGIWSAAEGFHLPWSDPGMTDLGPSVGYIFASLGLFYAAAGSVWSVDRVLWSRLGRLRWLATRPA